MIGGAQDLARGFIRAYNSLEQNKEYVNSLNVFPVPDGDTGTNMALTLRSAIRQMEQTECKSVYDVAKAISNGALMGARGNSGVILSQIFRGFARGLNGKDTMDTESLVSGFVNASETAYKAVMRPTEGTMLTVMREMAEYAEKDGANFQDVHEFAKAVLQAGEVSLMQTPELLPILKEAGVVDAGGKGLLVMLQGALSEEDGDIPGCILLPIFQ
jgi:dihydroxyacetone kinase-like predicted kinase